MVLFNAFRISFRNISRLTDEAKKFTRIGSIKKTTRQRKMIEVKRNNNNFHTKGVFDYPRDK